MMKINFKHRITILGRVKGENEVGETVYEWKPLTSLWADIKTLRGTEQALAISQENKITYRFIIRYQKNIDAFQKIQFKGQEFIIDSVLNDNEQNKTMTIIATNVV